ncbi:MAG TPA: AbrB family transcriptional regulator [Cyanobacteria bacterium UBA11049]|nr:AbrB family transcriptional regulator [Cyanobacteria bacterium UBA11049]
MQSTISQAPRKALGITEGDCVAVKIQPIQVVVKKIIPHDRDYLDAVAGTWNEWVSAANEAVYRHL